MAFCSPVPLVFSLSVCALIFSLMLERVFQDHMVLPAHSSARWESAKGLGDSGGALSSVLLSVFIR